MSLYSDLIKVANQMSMLQPLNIDEILANRATGNGMLDLGLITSFPLYSAADKLINPITSIMPALSPVTGASSMGIISALQEMMTKKKRQKALQEEGLARAQQSPFTILDNQMNQIRQRSHRLGQGA